MLVMKRSTDFAKSMSTRWKDFGRFCVLGYVPIGEFLRKNCPYIWVSLSLSITTKKRGKALLSSLLQNLLASLPETPIEPWLKICQLLLD